MKAAINRKVIPPRVSVEVTLKNCLYINLRYQTIPSRIPNNGNINIPISKKPSSWWFAVCPGCSRGCVIRQCTTLLSIMLHACSVELSFRRSCPLKIKRTSFDSDNSVVKCFLKNNKEYLPNIIIITGIMLVKPRKPYYIVFLAFQKFYTRTSLIYHFSYAQLQKPWQG